MYRSGQHVYFGLHQDTDVCTGDARHVVWEFVVTAVSARQLTARRLHDGELFSWSTWPVRYFGDALNGPFSTVEAAAAKLCRPLPKFDSEGNLIK